MIPFDVSTKKQEKKISLSCVSESIRFVVSPDRTRLTVNNIHSHSLPMTYASPGLKSKKKSKKRRYRFLA